MTLTTAGLAIWILLIAIILVIIVPLAVALLRRALRAARKIEAYLADMLAAGVGIAANTASIAALDETIAAALAMKPVAQGIEAKTGAVAGLLSSRIGPGSRP